MKRNERREKVKGTAVHSGFMHNLTENILCNNCTCIQTKHNHTQTDQTFISISEIYVYKIQYHQLVSVSTKIQ
jgi:hypothetical protein